MQAQFSKNSIFRSSLYTTIVDLVQEQIAVFEKYELFAFSFY
jgi:hypothetical protein